MSQRTIDVTAAPPSAGKEPGEPPVRRPPREAAVMFAQAVGDAPQEDLTACLDLAQGAAAGTRIVKRFGARLMLITANADSAARAAVAMQLALSASSAMEASRLGLGIGFHFGPVIQDNADVFGDTVNLAARLVEQAARGQILLVADTAQRMTTVYQRSTRRLYAVQLKGFEQEFTLCETIWRGDEAATFHPYDAVSARPSQAKLELRWRGQSLVLRRIVEEVTIGRDAGCRVVIDGEHASRHHCTIERRHDHFVVIDKSTNGTFVTIEGEEEVALRRDEIILRKKGWIAFGQRRGAGGELLEFSCD
jgi:adenylate cyclase